MKIPTVSVALVACDVERFLAEAVESILNQTFRDFEFVIVDFGSTDASPSIIRRYQERDPRIQFEVIPHCNRRRPETTAASVRVANTWPCSTRTTRLSRAAWHARWSFENRPEIAILGGAVELIDESGRRFDGGKGAGPDRG